MLEGGQIRVFPEFMQTKKNKKINNFQKKKNFRKIFKNFIFRKMPPVVGLTLKMQTKKNLGLRYQKIDLRNSKKYPFFICAVRARNMPVFF